jgi:hypothetical protein
MCLQTKYLPPHYLDQLKKTKETLWRKSLPPVVGRGVVLSGQGGGGGKGGRLISGWCKFFTSFLFLGGPGGAGGGGSGGKE